MTKLTVNFGFKNLVSSQNGTLLFYSNSIKDGLSMSYADVCFPELEYHISLMAVTNELLLQMHNYYYYYSTGNL